MALLRVREDAAMTTHADIERRDQHIADLRAALQRAKAEIAFAAGRETADDPVQATRLLGTVDDLQAVLDRTMLPSA
ncbi:hypothetical protein AMK19_23590 [Kitasatospora sp. CB01950]|nr:hypothetical protein AMK19_23590 [Kitasatospora sp. CB01950]